MTPADDGRPRHATRHVSLRVPRQLFDQLETMAAVRGESVSQTARRLLGEGLRPADRSAIDEAIATLRSVRDQLTRPPGSHDDRHHDDEHPGIDHPAPRQIDFLNAKTDLQRLLTDVARGEQYVITHAGAPRARLIGVEPGARAAGLRNR